MRIFRFGWWYAHLLYKVALGRRETRAPLTPGVRWRVWKLREDEKRRFQ